MRLRLAAASIVLATLTAAPAAAAAPSPIRSIARVPAADAVLAGDDRYVALSAAPRAIRVYDTRRRGVLTVRGSCGQIADVDGHRLLVRLRVAGCAPALVDLDRPGRGARPVSIAPALAPEACPPRGATPTCPAASLVEDYVQIAGPWLLGYASTVAASGPRLNRSAVARNIATGERRVLFEIPPDADAAWEAAAGDYAVLAIDEPGSEEGEIFPDRRLVARLDSGLTSPFRSGEYLYSLDRGRALTSDNGPVGSLRLRALPGGSQGSASVRLRRPVRIHDAAANAGSVAFVVQRRRPRRLSINLVEPSSGRRLFVSHTPRRPRDDYLCARVLPTRYAVVWSVIPGFCNRRGPIDYYTVSRVSTATAEGPQAQGPGRRLDADLRRERA